jgi:hypothetical protein
MQIDPAISIEGGALYLLEMEGTELSAAFTVDPFPLIASTVPNTVSISRLFLDSEGVIDPSPGPDPESDFLFFGVTTSHFGLGGAPPYIDGYPIGGDLIGPTSPGDSFEWAITPPAVPLRSLDVATATLGQVRDLLGTMIYDYDQGSIGTYTITNLTLLYVMNPNTATQGIVRDVAATLADELGGVYSIYSVTIPAAGWLRVFDATDPSLSLKEMADALATFIYDIT